MAHCMLCSRSVAAGDAVCPHCGGAVDDEHADAARGASGPSAGSPWSTDPTRVDGSDGGWVAPAPRPGAPEETASPWGGGPPAPSSPWDAGPTGPPGLSPPAFGAVPQAGWPAPAYPAPVLTDGYAIASLVTSIAGLALSPACGVTILACPVGAVLGHVSLARIRRGERTGEGLAVGGVVVGWIGTALLVLGVVALVAFFGALGSAF